MIVQDMNLRLAGRAGHYMLSQFGYATMFVIAPTEFHPVASFAPIAQPAE
jgi:hypothetical protein